MLEISLVEVIAGGPRLQFEFEQQLPGGEDPDAGDPILEAIELRHRGQPDRARALLEGLIEWDPRCLDAHAHLGGLAFDHNDPAAAQAHYATGVRTAESSLPDGSAACSVGDGSTTTPSYAACMASLSAPRAGSNTVRPRHSAGRCCGSARLTTKAHANCSVRSPPARPGPAAAEGTPRRATCRPSRSLKRLPTLGFRPVGVL